MKYDYLKALEADVEDYLESIDWENTYDTFNLEKFRSEVVDDLFDDDNVTGNTSGSYTFDEATAEKYLAHNLVNLEDACDKFRIDLGDAIRKGAEYCDVLIRCSLLPIAVSNVVDKLVFSK